MLEHSAVACSLSGERRLEDLDVRARRSLATGGRVLSPLEFQTAGQSVDWSTVIPFAISTHHPTEIEIWNTTAVPDGLAPLTLTELQQWAAEIEQP